jgi:hypothetical protein
VLGRLQARMPLVVTRGERECRGWDKELLVDYGLSADFQFHARQA